MKVNLDDLGPKIKGNSVTFKQYLPNIDREARVLVIGSFCDWEPENSLSLKYDSESDLWKGTLNDIHKGMHEYAYLIKTASWYSNPTSDPYARMTGSNGLSAFKLPAEASARLSSFRPPSPEKLVLYHLNIDDFNENFEGAKHYISYFLSQLDVNGIIFSPWVGYDYDIINEKVPIHFFAPDSIYGTPYDLKVMINECHKLGMAVIMEIDFSAVSAKFGFNQIYPFFENKPMLGRMDETGKKIYLDFNDELTAEFVFRVCHFWMDEFNVDGFRFLNVKDYWDGTGGEGFSSVVKRIHEFRKKRGMSEFFLFAGNTGHNYEEIINKTYTNGIDNRHFLKSIHRMAENRTISPDFWKSLDVNQMGVSDENKIGDDKIKNFVLNHIEADEYLSLQAKMGLLSGERDLMGNSVGDRKNHWWKTKPYALAQFTTNGIPVIHNGQEIAENRIVPPRNSSDAGARAISWHYLSDFAGKDMFRFYQKLIIMRRKFKSILSHNFFHYFTDPEHQVIVFKRYLDDESVIVAINFSNESYDVLIPFTSDGIWHEYLDDFDIKVENRQAIVKVPARYGRVFYQE